MVMVRVALAEWLRWAATAGRLPLGLGLSGLWAALVILMALASSDPGQNYVARLLILPIVVLWCLGYAVGRITQALRSRNASLLLPSSGQSTLDARTASLRKQQPALWWASVLICIAGIAGAFALQPGADGNVLHQWVRIAGNTLAAAVVAAVVYTGIRLRTAVARARFFLATAFVGATFVLWQAFDDTQRISLPTAPSAPGPAKSTASRDYGGADGSKVDARTGRQSPPLKAATPSAPTTAAEWATPLSEAILRYQQNHLALASKWTSDVEGLHFESMLTPKTLTSSQGRRQNREKLMRFESLLANYLAQLDALHHDYRANVLAIDIPAPQREDFVKEFEATFAASVAETQKLNMGFKRVELEIAKTILDITDLIEREESAVSVGSDGTTLLFERDAASDEYNTLLKALQKATVEEGTVIAKSSEAFRKRADSLNSATTGLR